MLQNLFFVSAANDDCDSLDLLVKAQTKEEALSFWRTHFALDEHALPSWVGQVPGVSAQGDPGAIDWGTLNP
jgi:hypothetical protein